MSNNNTILTTHNGTRQCDRFPSALSNDYIKIDERTFEDLIQQLSEYAKKVNFYNDENKEDGDWEPFFKEIYDYETHTIKMRSLQKQMSEGTVPPHLSLILSFLKLYQVQQNNLNRLTERHLEFYYKNILGFKPREGRVGNAVVFASPVKNISSGIIPKGTLFDAGKDAKGKTIMFESTDEVTINKAQINDCYYSYRHDDGIYDVENIQVLNRKQDSDETNTEDSIRKSIKLNFGFAIAISSFLEAKNRKYIDLGTLGEELNLEFFTIEYTSVNGWEKIEDKLYACIKNLTIGKKEAFSARISEILPVLDSIYGHTEIKNNRIESFLSRENTDKESKSERKKEPLLAEGRHNRGETRHYILKIDAVKNPMVPYNPKLHGEGYNSNNPIIRFIPVEEQNGKAIKNSKKNELWRILNIKREFFNDIYLHEENSTDNIIIENRFGMVNNVAGNSPFGYMCNKNDYFLVKINIPHREFYNNLKKDTYTINLDINGFHPEKNKDEEVYMPNMEYPVIQYTLNDDDHRIDKRMNKCLKNIETGAETTNPYTTLELNKAISYNSNILIPLQKMELFTIAPWGINKIDSLDSNTDSEDSDAVNYIFQDDKFPPLKYIEGEEESGIFIAISGISQPTCLNLYFELGSYNINKQKIKWSYLSKGNKWEEFSRTNICKDGTENFTKNGIVQLYLNKEVFRIKDNIPADKIWLYISTQKLDDPEKNNLDGFLQNVRYIQTQAIEVTFSKESVGSLQNEIYLPQGSITKLVKNITGIKKVEQPFDGFVGVANETTNEFNCRVSEKLRHKGKAWSCWDYERILLEKFPQLAAVKCVPCSNNKYPGTVKIVVFPNVSLIPQSKISQPKIDAFTQNGIYNYLKTICSPFVKIEIHNPSYNELTITGKITLRKEYHDHAYYLKLIEEALTNYLAPWKSDPTNINLITHIPTNLEIQYFLEKLEYVDFIKELSVKPETKNEEALTVITYKSIEITIE